MCRYSGLGYKCHLDCVLGEKDHLFKFIGKPRYLAKEDLPQKILIDNYSVKGDFLENNRGKMTAGAYLMSITKYVNSVQQIGTGALLVVDDHILALIWGTDSIYLFDSHSKDENNNLSSSGTASNCSYLILENKNGNKINLLWCSPTNFVLSSKISESSLYCQFKVCH